MKAKCAACGKVLAEFKEMKEYVKWREVSLNCPFCKTPLSTSIVTIFETFSEEKEEVEEDILERLEYEREKAIKEGAK
jgi:phage FluMu protein Com